MKISIIGLGWIGAPLAHSLIAYGHKVKGTTRDENKLNELRSFRIEALKLDQNDIPSEELFDCDLCVLNIPPFEGQLTWFREWPWKPTTHVIFLSSTSVYGDQIGTLTETVTPSPVTTNAKVLLDEESWIKSRFDKWTILRLGGLFDEDRNPVKSLSGKKDIKGKSHPINLIHRKDVVGLIETIIEKNILRETINVVCDDHRTRKEFYQLQAKKKSLPLPEFDEEDLTTGKVVSNEKLKNLYQLKVRTIS